MGSGKSTFGKKLAHKLKYSFIDLDEYIAFREEKTVRELFSLNGESYFREKESFYLKNTKWASPFVIACGGGTPCFMENMTWMNKDGLTVYLELPAKTLQQRLTQSTQERPLIAGMKDDELCLFIEKKLSERKIFYEQAGLKVNGLHPNIKNLIAYLEKYNN